MKWIRRLLLLLIVVLLAVSVFAFWPFPDRLGYLSADADAYDVEILRDTWGVPHVFGVTDADAAFGLAYAHAEDDFLTIQQGLVAARGDLSKVYGMDGTANDYMVALLRIWEVMDAQYETLSPEVIAICEAYAAGLNLYAAQHPSEAFRGTFPVTGKDVVAASVHKSPLFFGLDGVLGRLFEQVNSEEGVLNGAAFAWQPYLASPTGIGSNTFAVSPSRTSDGSTFFAVNSHQPWTGPVAWYEAHVHSEAGWNATGALFPGMPVITHGHNENLAWAFTVNSPDLIDVYELTLNPDNQEQYLLDGEWRDFQKWQTTIEVNLVALAGLGDEYFGQLNIPISQDVYWSAHGPVLRNENEAYAMRYSGYGVVGIYEQLYLMNRAGDVREWLNALAHPGLPMFNVGYADKEGNIGYVYNALMPDRDPAFDWSENLPGDTSAAIWTEYVRVSDMPMVWNPSVGFIQNANSTPYKTTGTDEDPQESDFSPTFGIETKMTNRALRLTELFSADEQVTWEAFKRYKYDMGFSADSSMPTLINLITRNSFDDPNERKAARLLADWNLQTTPDSLGASIAILTLNYLRDYASFSVSGFVDADISQEAAVAAFKDAVATLMTDHGKVAVAWSQVNRVQRGLVDLGIGGAPDVPHAVYGNLNEQGRFVGIAGDSSIMLVRWDAMGNLSSESVHQFGSATLDASSPHYSDQVPLFVGRQLRPVWFSEADIRANLERAYRPQQP
jgi:penicillin amidase/acyl-homoserine-lactone acylase